MAKKETENKDAAFNIPIFTPENRSKVEEFFEKFKQPLSIGLSVILVVLLGYYGYTKIILEKKNVEATDLMYMAEQYFSIDSFDYALNGKAGANANEETFYGFLDIIDEFGLTKAGNLAKYYAGLCYLHLGDYEEAVSYLKKYRTHSEIIEPLSLGALGDAYSELEEYDKAISYYIKAAKAKENDFTAPHFYMKAGKTLEYIENYKRALEIFELIKEDYPQTQEANDIDKYIGRAKSKVENS